MICTIDSNNKETQFSFNVPIIVAISNLPCSVRVLQTIHCLPNKSTFLMCFSLIQCNPFFHSANHVTRISLLSLMLL